MPQHPEDRVLAEFGVKGKREEVRRGSQAFVRGAFHSITPALDTTFPKALIEAVTRVGWEEVLPPCGRCLQLQLTKGSLSALPIHKA